MEHVLKRMDRIIKERNHLNHELIMANIVIDNYQKWFKAHEHLVDPLAVHNTIDKINESTV